MGLLQNIGLLAICRDTGKQHEIHTISNAALAWEEGTIQWAGPEEELPDRYKDDTPIDAGKHLVVPGLIDCHTHLAFGGWRADEFEMRIRGKSYLDIAKAGGGILSTVRATRKASEDQLFERCVDFLNKMARLGVTTVECKSGYGLDTAQEMKLLRVYRRLGETQPVRIISTFLGAHFLSPEYKHDRKAYLELITNEMIPAIADKNLAGFCDAFVEDTAFTVTEARLVFETGIQYGLIPKVHADQLTDGGGAQLAAEVKAVSADHLEQISEEGIRALSESGVCAVDLPLASLYLNQPFMPARKLIEAGIPVAIATDFNPGSAPSYDLHLAMLLACTRQLMTPAEVLKAVTINAARALNIDHETGSLEAGKSADFVIIDAPDVNQWLYHFRPDACVATYYKGQRIP